MLTNIFDIDSVDFSRMGSNVAITNFVPSSDARWCPEQTAGVSESAQVVSQHQRELMFYTEILDKDLLDRNMCQIRAELEADPVEDGYTHQGEESLGKFFRRFGAVAGAWILDALSGLRWPTSLKADLIKLLGRQTPLGQDWRKKVVNIGLSSSNVVMRDAAVQAAEAWGDAEIVRLLLNHKEPCDWLADYINRIALNN